MNRDISNWGWGQILELPDHLFGRRYCVGCNLGRGGPGNSYAISDMSLPEKMVIWELNLETGGSWDEYNYISLALGDHLPANDAEFDVLEQLFPDIGLRTGTRRDFPVRRNSIFNLSRVKIGVDTAGQRLVGRGETSFFGYTDVQAILVVSSVPRSIPEWFV